MARAVEGIDIKDLKSLADEGKKQLGSGVVALVGVTEDGKASIVVGVTHDLDVALQRGRSGAQGRRGARRQGRRRAARHGAGRRSGRREGRCGARGDRGRARRMSAGYSHPAGSTTRRGSRSFIGFVHGRVPRLCRSIRRRASLKETRRGFRSAARGSDTIFVASSGSATDRQRLLHAGRRRALHRPPRGAPGLAAARCCERAGRCREGRGAPARRGAHHARRAHRAARQSSRCSAATASSSSARDARRLHAPTSYDMELRLG